MKLIKLDAIDSTNVFLKGLSSRQELENFTVVTAESQTKGKGQMGSVWISESSKNLIMSVLIKDFIVGVRELYNLNIVVSLATIHALELINIPNLSIKWPNDIMSYNKKIGGILIENTIKSDGSILSIVGLGLNVNQTNFQNLPKASSLAVICNSEFNKENLLFSIIEILKEKVKLYADNSQDLWRDYSDKLFKKGIAMPFFNSKKGNFMGIIQGVSSTGKLLIILEDDAVCEFDIKEIQMLY